MGAEASPVVKVWTTPEGFSSNAAIIAGRKWRISPYLASRVIVASAIEDLRAAGVEEVSFTLSGKREALWRISLG